MYKNEENHTYLTEFYEDSDEMAGISIHFMSLPAIYSRPQYNTHLISILFLEKTNQEGMDQNWLPPLIREKLYDLPKPISLLIMETNLCPCHPNLITNYTTSVGLIIYCYITNYPKLYYLKQGTFIMWVFCRWGIQLYLRQMTLAQSVPWGCSQGVSQECGLTWWLCWGQVHLEAHSCDC